MVPPNPFAVFGNTYPAGVAANLSEINDILIQIITSLLAAGIYGVVVFASYGVWLPKYLVIHFGGLRDITAAYSTNFPWLILSSSGWVGKQPRFSQRGSISKIVLPALSLTLNLLVETLEIVLPKGVLQVSHTFMNEYRIRMTDAPGSPDLSSHSKVFEPVFLGQ